MGDDLSHLSHAVTSRRTRFSLRALFYLVTISALAMGLLLCGRKLSRLRAELDDAGLEISRWRREAGGLGIRDPKDLHAIAVQTEVDDFWKWRVWIPESKQYRVRMAVDDIPEAGIPSSAACTSSVDAPGEQIIRVWLQRDRTSETGTLRLTLEAEGQGGGAGCGAGTIPLAQWDNPKSVMRGIGSGTMSYGSPPSLELFRCRLASSPSAESLDKLSQGFMIWLEQVP